MTEGFQRPLPAIEPQSGFFWTGGAEGELLIARCRDCGLYQHPPFPRCPRCTSEAVAPEPVSGRGKVATFTINEQAWMPGMPVPFVFAAVELVEQPQLYVFTNIIGPVEQVRSGMAVHVAFEQQEDVWLPLFRPDESAEAGHGA